MTSFGQEEYKFISKRAQLLLSGQENKVVDFKRDVKKLDQEDFVAFANTDIGGTILVGVDEEKDAKGIQHPKIYGCNISDDIKLMINNKAFNCSPPVDISIHAENLSRIPFYRIEVFPGKHKPYCTLSGVYKVRQDGRNRALLPKELLQMFLNLESDSFLQKFKQATLEMRGELELQNRTLMNRMWDMAFETETNIERVIGELGESLGEVFEQVDHATQNIQTFYDEMLVETETLKQDLELNYDIKERLNHVDKNIVHLAWKLNAILEHYQIEDPEITFARNEIKGLLKGLKSMSGKHKSKPDKKFFENVYAHCSRIIKENYTVKDIINWYNE